MRRKDMTNLDIRVLSIGIFLLCYFIITFIIFYNMSSKKIVDCINENKNLSSIIDSLKIENDSLSVTIDSLILYNSKVKSVENKIIKLRSDIYNYKDINDLAKAIVKASNKYPLISEELLISIAYVESTFNKYAKSKGGDLGYYQINSNVHPIDYNMIYEPNYNINWACRILNRNLKAYNNNHIKALNGYNGWVSEKNKYAMKVLNLKNKIESKK